MNHKTQQLIDRNGEVIWIDSAIAQVVHLLWCAGVRTLSSCEDHATPERHGACILIATEFNAEIAVTLMGDNNVVLGEAPEAYPDARYIFFPLSKVNKIVKRLTPRRTKTGTLYHNVD